MKGNEMENNSITVTLHNPSPEHRRALLALLDARLETTTEETITPKKRGRPAKTVSDDEEESFGTKEIEKEELEDDEDGEEEESEEEESALDWDDVKAAVNKYGAKSEEGMRSILLGFNIKTTKELQKHPKKWEAVYRKVNSKLKALKKQ